MLHRFELAPLKKNLFFSNSAVESKNFSGACRLALALQLFDAFGIEDFVVPLLLQDKLSLALDFLTGSATLQVDTVLFLDDYVNAPHRLLDLAL